MAAVYDDEKEKTLKPSGDGSHDNLGVHPERREAEADSLNKLFDDESGHGSKADSSKAEDAESKKLDQGTVDTKGAGSWKTNIAKQKLKVSNNKLLKRGALVGGGSAILIIILFFFLIISSLSIPNLAQNIAGYQFARTSRLMAKSASEATSEKIALDAADEGAFTAVKDKYASLRDSTWGKLDKYRPQKVLENMKATGELDFKYQEADKLFGRRKLTAVVVNGEEIQAADQRFGRFISNYNEKIRFSAELQANLDSALDGSNTLVRGSVSKSIREELGIKLSWWEQKGKKFLGLKTDEADRLQLRDASAKIDQDPPAPSAVSGINETSQEVEDKTKAAVADNAQADEINKTGQTLPKAAQDALESGTRSTALDTALSVGSTTYAVAVPLCIIYDGSVNKAQPAIDREGAQLQRTYYSVATASDQIHSGATTTEAVGAMSRKISGADQSVPVQRAAGHSPTSDLQPQASAHGDFTIFDALFGSSAPVGVINSIASGLCPVLTDWKTGVATGFAEAVAGFFSGGSSKGAEQTLSVAVTSYIREMVSNLFSKETFARILGEASLTAGATVAAKLLVISKVGAQTNGLARDAQYANQADAGGDLTAQELNRKQFYGRPLTQAEIALSNSADRQYIALKESKKSLYERYLDGNNPYSVRQVAGTQLAVALGGRSVPKIVGNLSKNINPASLLASFTHIFSFNKVTAQDVSGDPYKIIQWGWSPSEEGLIDSNQTYSPLENAKILENSGRQADIETAYGKCWKDTFGTLIQNDDISRDKNGDVVDTADAACSPVNLGPNNKNFGDLVFRYRIDQRFQNTLDHLTSIQDTN